MCFTGLFCRSAGLFVHTMKFPPGDPRPPSVSFPGSSLQARGGRLSLHVSPEMSHHLKHTCTHSHTVSPPHTALRLPPCSSNTRQISLHLHWLLRRARTQREKTCVRVCVTLACIWMNVAACGNFECVMKCVMCLHIAAQAHCWLGSLEACLTQLRGTERKVIIS